MSPTQRTIAYLKAQGYTVAIVERWNPYAKIRQDLFGFADLLAIKPDHILAVQATSTGNISAREKKILAEPRAHGWIMAGGDIQIIGWSKKGPRGKRKTWTPTIRTVAP